jgi:hypothetical protein
MLLANWVFAATNTLMVIAALTGAWVDHVNRRHAARDAGAGQIRPRVT